ncbi:MAG: carboxypeptidase-like regulatory domain-containing protein [Crocinitomicaceae bacterium]|nr:carboxypeptidase-like regulatory domain-containing protein [Crocinitomicaceae bacterium]
MKKALLITAFMFICSLVFTQVYEISGTIVNKRQQPMSGATIVIVGRAKGTFSNQDGKFTLMHNFKEGDFEIHIMLRGYKTVSVLFEGGHNIKIGTISLSKGKGMDKKMLDFTN